MSKTTSKSVMGSVKEWLLKYLYFSKATTCIRGLVFSHSIANHAIVSILITYLAYNWGKDHFQLAAVVTNLQEGFSGTMVIFLAHFSTTYEGSFKLLVTTNAAYIAGLAILWRSAGYMTFVTAAKVYYVAVLLLLFGEAGREALLKEFLDEQYSRERVVTQSDTIDDDELQERQDALSVLPWLLGSIVPLFLLKTTWTQIFMISTIVMAVFYVLFWCGYSSYFIHRQHSLEKESMQQIDVEVATIGIVDMQQRHNISQQDEELAEPPRGDFWIFIRKMNSKKGKNIRKQIISVWVTFLVFGVASAAGNTFFYEQMSNLRVPFNNYNIAVYFNVISSLSKYAASSLWGLKFPKKMKNEANTLVRIGCGLASVVVCLATAWRVEKRRLREVMSLGVADTEDVVPMSIFRLAPQFALLGIAEGLLVEGLIKFFVQRVAKPNDKVMVEYYASRASEFVIGVGKILTALSILAFRTRWFDDNINMSRLDKYYRALTIFSLVGLFYYVFVSIMCYTKEGKDEVGEEEGEEKGEEKEEGEGEGEGEGEEGEGEGEGEGEEEE